MSKTKKQEEKVNEPEKKEYKFTVSEQNVQKLDAFHGSALNAHAQGVLDYKTAFLKSVELIRSSITAEEV